IAPGRHHHQHGPAHLLDDSLGRDRPREHPGFEAQLQRRSLQFRPFWTIAHDPETSLSSQQRYGTEQVLHPLLFRQASHIEQVSVVMNRHRRARIRGEIRFHHQPLAREASLDELPSRKPGHRDQQVDVPLPHTYLTLNRRDCPDHRCQRVRSAGTMMPDARPGKSLAYTLLGGRPGSMKDSLGAYETRMMK